MTKYTHRQERSRHGVTEKKEWTYTDRARAVKAFAFSARNSIVGLHTKEIRKARHELYIDGELVASFDLAWEYGRENVRGRELWDEVFSLCPRLMAFDGIKGYRPYERGGRF